MMDYGDLVKELSQVKGAVAQQEVLSRFIADRSGKDAASALDQLTREAIKSPQHAKAFLSMLGILGIEKSIGRPKFSELAQAAREPQFLSKLFDQLQSLKDMDVYKSTVLRAKLALIMQVLFILGERMEEDGKPRPSVDGLVALRLALSTPDIKGMLVQLKTDDFPLLARSYLASLLKESDFRETGEGKSFEFTMNEAMVRRYSDGTALTTLVTEEGSKVTELLIARMGLLIITRLNLVLRTLKMYHIDHPAAQPVIGSLHDAIMPFLQQKDTVTLSRLGTDFLVDEVKLKKRTRHTDDLAALLEERNVLSLTFFKGIKIEELKMFIDIFNIPLATFLKKGGFKGAIEERRVHHVAIDQFRYGIISGDKDATPVTADKSLESMILSQVLTRMKDGKEIGGLSPDEFASAVKEIVGGKGGESKEMRQNLASMLLTMNPELANALVLQDPATRDRVAWNTVQGLLNQMLSDIASGNAERVNIATKNLKQILQMAINRQKETSIQDMLEGVTKALWENRSKPQVETHILDLISFMVQELIVSERVDVAQAAFGHLNQFMIFSEEASKSVAQPQIKRLAEYAKKVRESVLDERVVDVLISQFSESDDIISERAGKILSEFRRPETAEALFKVFLHPNRVVRKRALEILISLGECAKQAAIKRIENINNANLCVRNEDKTLTEDKWYEIRNSMEIVAQSSNQQEQDKILKLGSDQDPRVRKEVLALSIRINPEAARQLAVQHISDVDEVAQTAIGILGALRDQDSLDLVFQQFQKRPDLREQIIKAVGMTGGAKAESFLLAALKFSPYKSIERIFYDSPQLIISAIKAMKFAGGENATKFLEAFLKKYKNPIRRALFLPMRSALSSDELIRIAQDTLNSLKARISSRAESKAG